MRSRWSSPTPEVLFATEGDTRRVTGGNVYARRMLAALRRSGIRVRVLRLERGRDRAVLRKAAGTVIVDTIAARRAAPMLDALRVRGARVCTLALMERGAASLGHVSDRVVAVSHALARAVVAEGVPRSRVRVIVPGVTRYRVSAREAGEVRGLCVANWTADKGIRTLIAAVEWLPDVSLDLVGGTPDRSYARGVHADLRRAALRRRVRVHGVKRGAALGRLYARATFFALPSIRESYGMAVSEALAAGLPVIACDIPATREVAGGAALLVPRGRVDPLADAIDRVAHDARLRERLSRRARARAKRFPTWSESERRFVREIRALIG